MVIKVMDGSKAKVGEYTPISTRFVLSQSDVKRALRYIDVMAKKELSTFDWELMENQRNFFSMVSEYKYVIPVDLFSDYIYEKHTLNGDVAIGMAKYVNWGAVCEEYRSRYVEVVDNFGEVFLCEE